MRFWDSFRGNELCCDLGGDAVGQAGVILWFSCIDLHLALFVWERLQQKKLVDGISYRHGCMIPTVRPLELYKS